MTLIEKKSWSEFFELILAGKKDSDYRLADFEAKEGDILVQKEWDPKTKQFTGREIRMRIKNIKKIKPLEYHTKEEIEQHGAYIIDMEKEEK